MIFVYVVQNILCINDFANKIPFECIDMQVGISGTVFLLKLWPFSSAFDKLKFNYGKLYDE